VPALAVTESPANLPPLAGRQNEFGGILTVWLAGALLLLIFICSLWLRLPGVMINGGEITYDRGLFLCINCATLTGFQQSIGFNDFNPNSAQGPAIVLILTIAGSLFAMMAGGLAGVRALRMPFSDRQVITAAMVVELLAIVVGTAAMGGNYPFDLVYQSACAFGNSGAVLLTAKGHHYFPSYQSWSAQGVILPLSVIGGLGLPVLMDLYYCAIRATPKLSFHTYTVIKLTAAVYLVATAVLFASQLLHRESPIAVERLSQLNAPAASVDARSAFLAASTAAINSRTLGMPFEYLHRFPKSAYWFILLLMAIGANPAGAGGGLKTTTLWKLFTGFADVLRGRTVGRTFGVAGVWVGLYLLIAGIGFLLLGVLQPQIPSDRLIFLTISALSNVGLTQDTHDPISMVGPGLYLLGLVALVGRLTPIAILWWLAKTRDADVLVG
jgi:Trk-type K+ transport system membrane component